MKAFYGLTFFVIWFFAELLAKFLGSTENNEKSASPFGASNKTVISQMATNSFFFVPCDTRVAGVYTYCNPSNPGTFFIGFTAIDPTGTIRQVKDLGGANPTNRGKHVQSLPADEPAGLTTTPLVITGIGTDTIEHWLFGPYVNGANFNIALVDTTGSMCDTVKVASGTFNCNDFQAAPDSACTDAVPLYYFDFSASTFDVPSSSSNEVFLFMDRTREPSCCGTTGNCFEFIIKLNTNNVGLDLSAAGSGANGSDLYAAPLNGFNCSNMVAGPNDPWTVFVPNNQDPVICLSDASREWIILTCKSGGNKTSAILSAISRPNVSDSVTIDNSNCDLSITANNALDPKWSSYDDPGLNNIIGYAGTDSSILFFEYNSAFYGPITNCAGDTFHYVVSARPADTICIGNIILKDTAEIIVYPTFSVSIIQTCNLASNTITLFADTASTAAGCPYDFKWYNLSAPAVIVGMTNTLVVPAVDGEMYRVLVTRSDLPASVNSCLTVDDTVKLSAVAIIDCNSLLPKDTLFQCLVDTLRSDTTQIQFTGCYFVKPLVFVIDNNLGGKGCIGDTLRINRLYISDRDRNLGTTNDRDTCIQHFLIVDSTAPAFTFFPNDTTIECNADTSVGAIRRPTAGTDNCMGAVRLTRRDSIRSGICPARDTILRIWKLSDTCNNFITRIHRITRVDTKPPIPAFTPRDTTVACVSNIPLPVALTGIDSCGGAVALTVKDTVFRQDSICINKKIIRRTYTLLDVCGNDTSLLQLITIKDTIPPVLICPRDTTVTCFTSIPAPDSSLVNATDNCGGHVRVTFLRDSVSTADPAPCINKRRFYRIYRGLDTCDNEGRCIQLIRVNDSIPPSITCPAPITVACRGDVPASSFVLATDNCSTGNSPIQIFTALLLGSNESPPNASTATGFTTVTINNILNTMRVQVTFTGLLGTTTAAHIHAPTAVAFAGNIGVATTTPTFTGFPPGVSSGVYDNTFDMTLAGSYNAGYVAANGGTAASAFVALKAAMFAGKSYLNVHSNVFPGGEIRGFLVPSPAIALVKDSIPSADSSCINNLVIYRRYSATDECGNVAYCTQIIRVKDSIPPVISNVPGDTSVFCAVDIPVFVGAAGVLATDNCGPTRLSFIRQVLDSTCINHKRILNIWIATDTCQNMSRDTQVIQVIDTLAPVILNVPDNDTISCASEEINPAQFGVRAIDSCEVSLEFRRVVADSICINKKKILNIWTARDSCFHVTIDTQIVVVNDTIPPQIINGFRDTTVSCVQEASFASRARVTSATDNCDSVALSLVVKTIDSTCINNKKLLGIWTAIDACGNTAIDTVTITIVDSLAPEILNVPANDTVDCASSVIEAFQITPPVFALDSCEVSLSFRREVIDSTCINHKTILNIWTARDSCFHVTIDTQVVVVNDTIPPQIINVPRDTTVFCAVDIPVLVGAAPVTATDNCILVRLTYSRQVLDSTCINHKRILNIWIAIDTCQNMSRDTQVIQVIDTLSPVILNVPANDTVDCASSVIEAPQITPPVIAVDSCEVSLSFRREVIDSTCINHKTILNIWTARDSCFHMTIDTQVVVVNDTIPPIISGIPANDTVDCYKDIQPNFLLLIISENCGAYKATFERKVLDSVCANQKKILNIWTAIDSCGNMAIDTQTIVVNDTIPPVIPMVGNVDTVECGQIFDIVFPVPSDNCDEFVLLHSDISVKDSSCPGNYTILIIFSATDSCGNTTVVRDSIVKIDTTGPIIVCPQGPDTIEVMCFTSFPSPYTSLDSFDYYGGYAADECCLDTASFTHTDYVKNIQGMVIINRFYKISDCCGHTDSCEQIFRMPPCFLDLALRKQIDGPGPFFVSPGGNIPFKITVYNQFIVAADSIKIIDYLPSVGSTVTTAGWINNGDGTSCITLSRANGLLPPSGLLNGDSVEVYFTVMLGFDIGQAILYNEAEIFSAQDTFQNDLDDIDSDPDGVQGNDDTVDDEVNQVPPVDEDDADVVQFYVCGNLTCVDKVNGSVDANCEKCFTAADFLKGVVLPDEFYTIELYDAGGNKLPSNCVGREWLGYTLTYQVHSKAPCAVNTCWGKVLIEDKYPPQVGDTIQTLTCFQIAQLPKEKYKVDDNCIDSVVVTVASESFTDYGCDSPRIQGLVTRQLIVSDPWGNQSNLTVKYYVLKISLDSIICPRDTMIDCSLEVVRGVSIKDPSRSGAPQVMVNGKLVTLWPNSPACKLTVVEPKDEIFPLCGKSYKILRYWRIVDWCTGEDTVCRQWIVVKDTTRPIVYDTTLATYNASPHDCGQYVDLPALRYSDCNTVTQTYTIKYTEEGVVRVITGNLPATHIWLPKGDYVVDVNVSDACNNRGSGKIYLRIIDITPPTPVCNEFTQVTVDPASCWASVAAQDLDNGSHDNCCDVLHFAAAHMDSIVYWRNYWSKRIEAEVGNTEFWKYKESYDAVIEDWINCYVFSDTVHFGECGNKQVVLRVYEACGVPRYDPHVFPCSPHAWFCYNTYREFRLDFNFNWFNSRGAKSCGYRPDLGSLSFLDKKYKEYGGLNYLYARFEGAVYDGPCAQFYFPSTSISTNPGSSVSNNPPGTYCSARLYNDCMVNVLVDDKQPPVVDYLDDIIVYCDNAPDGSGYPNCDKKGGDHYTIYPGELKDSKKVVHGYYGGSYDYDIHMGAGDHNDPQACEENKGWAPIYCKNWLYIDSFDRAGHINPKDYFDIPVLVDRKRPLNRTLKANEFTFTDNCALNDTTLKFVDNGTLNGCSEGWIQRTWTIEDQCGNKVTASQKVVVKHRSDFEVLFPRDTVVTCDFLNRTDTSERGAGRPKIYDDECEQIGLTYKDEIFNVEDSACYKIVRTWTLIDWCLYDPNQHSRKPDVIVDDRYRANSTNRSCVYRYLKDNNDGYMQYVQIIKVIDEIRPEITCSDQNICIDANCSTTVNIPLVATDNCSNDIEFRINITRPDNTHDVRVGVNSISGTFNVGVYSVQIIARDRCGNEDTCVTKLTFKDCKKPTPYCVNGLATVVMPSTGNVEIWAKDFDLGSFDNCTTDASKLRFSFTNNVATANKLLRCSDIPNGREEAITLQIWVTDEAGNQDFCTTYILLQDNGGQPGGVCVDTTGAAAAISGRLLTEEKEGVEFATIEIKGSSNIPVSKTKSDGTYAFSNIPMNGNQSLKALRDDSPMNGISTLDLVLIQKHILGTEPLKSPYKVIAADVDYSNDVSVIDLIELRKLILGLYDKLPNSTSWKFIPGSYQFTDPLNPWGYPTEDVLHDMSDHMVRDFVGIKIGDVNSSAVAHSLMGTEIRNAGTGLIFEVQDRTFRKGDLVRVEFKSSNFRGISGFQGTLKLEDGILKLAGVGEQSMIKLKDQNIGRRWENEGLITMSWNTNSSIDLTEKDVLFSIVFTAQSDGRLSEALRLGSQRTIAESYEGKGELGNLSIKFVGKNGLEVTSKSQLYQNYPNPFDNRTIIGINLAESTRGALKITDITGRTIKVIERDWLKGYHEVWLDRRDIKASGVLYYSFESLSSGNREPQAKMFRAVKKMVIID